MFRTTFLRIIAIAAAVCAITASPATTPAEHPSAGAQIEATKTAARGSVLVPPSVKEFVKFRQHVTV